MLLQYAVLVCVVKSALSVITTTPGMQRKSLGETATLQWSVTEPLSSYSVSNLQSGMLSTNANYIMESKKGVITLVIKNIQLTDAGNYSLSVTIGSATQIDSSALLFVYGYPTISVTQTSGGSPQQPSTEGDTVELTCTAISTSLPAAYRPKMYYRWSLSSTDTLQNISSGPAKRYNSDELIPGYSIKDDGKTLVIASVQYRDTYDPTYCNGQEQWSPYWNSSSFKLPLRYRPYLTSRIPPSKKFNAIVSDFVSLTLYFSTVPALTSASNWSFINTAGQAQDLPANSSFSNTNSLVSLQFILTSEVYYGNYSITLSNIIGSTAETLQVLRPGPPDAPSSVKTYFISHYRIVIAWNCMWSNGRQQTISRQLKVRYNDSVVDSSNTTILSTNCYNSIYTTDFKDGIQPETDYEVLVWSTNNLGSSDIIRLPVKTTQIFKFFVSQENISLNENQAIVNFSATGGKITELAVACCLELTGACVYSYYYNLNSTTDQITFYSLPSGDVYIFDFTVYGGYPNVYYLTMVNGIRVSRNGDAVDNYTTESGGEKTNNLLITVIVLGVLLGVAVLALIGCLIAFLVFKRRQETQLNTSHQIKQPSITANTTSPLPITPQNNQAYEEDNTYEAVDNNAPKSDAHYTSLEGHRNS